ncbi:hypothetical protein IOCL2690_000633200 [Leishmania lindenbergi]|uniref:Uncharacterized protein n=1 Tax=Leishmania lindenbergi TaxID=651832 RepID=A0AAW3A3X8_9TRYP
MDNRLDGSIRSGSSPHPRPSTTAEPRYGWSGRDEEGIDNNYDQGSSASVRRGTLMEVWDRSRSVPTQKECGAPATATRRRRRSVVIRGMFFRDGGRVDFTVLLCCYCSPFTRRLLGKRGRRRNSVMVVGENAAKNVILSLRRMWE